MTALDSPYDEKSPSTCKYPFSVLYAYKYEVQREHRARCFDHRVNIACTVFPLFDLLIFSDLLIPPRPSQHTPAPALSHQCSHLEFMLYLCEFSVTYYFVKPTGRIIRKMYLQSTPYIDCIYNVPAAMRYLQSRPGPYPWEQRMTGKTVAKTDAQKTPEDPNTKIQVLLSYSCIIDLLFLHPFSNTHGKV